MDNEQKLEDDSLREPMELCQNGGDRTGFSRKCHNAGCVVLDALKTTKFGCWEECREKHCRCQYEGTNARMTFFLVQTFSACTVSS